LTKGAVIDALKMVGGWIRPIMTF